MDQPKPLHVGGCRWLLRCSLLVLRLFNGTAIHLWPKLSVYVGGLPGTAPGRLRLLASCSPQYQGDIDRL